MNSSPESIGTKAATIPVALGTQFLEQFSEQLYSSPQKALEELIANGWDAGANLVDVRIPADLAMPNASICVFDNGQSMDADGLRLLWHIAFSPKVKTPTVHGRQVIGKFGIGKLATYVLARKLTYICKGGDGKIRRVTMDYGDVERQAGVETGRLLSDLELDLFEVEEQDVLESLKVLPDGTTVASLIREPLSPTEPISTMNEFGGPPAPTLFGGGTTWTLVILSELKPAALELKLGILRRMLTAALPIGDSMAIKLNGTTLESAKLEQAIVAQWHIGPELGIDFVEVSVPSISDDDADDEEAGNEEAASDANPTVGTTTLKVAVSGKNEPFPHLEVPGLGIVTGTVRLFQERISGGKSAKLGASNGFHVNVLGRVVNEHDPSFGEKDLSHAAWARFRMAVRADGLNPHLTTDREKFREHQDVKVFRALLRRVFNKARSAYDADENALMPDGGDVLVRSLGVVSLSPLRSAVTDILSSNSSVPSFFDVSGIENQADRLQTWKSETADHIQKAVGEVKFEQLPDDQLVRFRIVDSTIVVNSKHPFVLEHGRSKSEKDLVRTVAMINLLTDVYALEQGVSETTLQSIQVYRDRLLRFKSLERRNSGIYIATLLREFQHDSANSKRMEAAVSDALRYLGFHVADIATSGNPEGVGSAFPYPTMAAPTTEEPHPPLYRFTFDAKSSGHRNAATNNLNLAGVAEHRDRLGADYALVIAPGFAAGTAVVDRCTQQKITPITAADLGRLLEITFERGAIPLTKLRELFQFRRPSDVRDWVETLETWITAQRSFTIDVFLRALTSLRGKVPDALSASTLAFASREFVGSRSVKDADVLAVATGLAILVPDLVGVEGDKIVVNASPERVAAAVAAQLDHLHDSHHSPSIVGQAE